MFNEEECNKVSGLLDAYRDGELHGGARGEVDAHLASCDRCRGALSQIDFVATSLSGMPSYKPRRDFADDIESIISQKSKSAPSDCEVIDPLLDAFHDNELDESEREQVLSHIAGCDSCNRALGEIDRVVGSLQQLAPIVCKRDFAEDFENILAARSNKVVAFKRPVAWISVAVAAAMALLVVSLHGFGFGGGTSLVANNSGPARPAIADKSGVMNSENGAMTGSSVGSNSASPEVAEVPQSNVGIATEALPAQPARPIVRTLRGGVTDIRNMAAMKGTVRQDAASQTSAAKNEIASNVPIDQRGDDNVIALYDGEASSAEQLGMTTDEDGLYAIKL